jgi:PAS domain S-box-containing protein
LVTISADGKITDVNSATELVTGYSREELIGKDFSHYFTEPKKAEQGYREVFTKGYVKDYPLAILHRTGKVTDVLYNATVYRDSDGVIQGVFAAARDITEIKKMEQQLKESGRLAAIGATAGMVGHDIRNPLQAIMSDTYLLRAELASMVDCKIKEGVIESIDSIEKNIGYINKIVADLQDYARPLRPECVDVDLYELVTSVFSPINIPDGLDPSIEIDTHLSIRSDPTILRRIFANLIINAIQAMPNGGKLTIQASKGSDTAVISVEDTGVGIPEDIKPKLFTPMMTTKPKGQGLGLAVVKRLVESLGGSITFESELGKGTKFVISLPKLQQNGTREF